MQWPRFLLLWAGACVAADAADVTGEISPAHAILASKSQVFHEQALNEQLRVAVWVP
jgi:hypothetical protein